MNLSEILLILLVALLVIKPERLPEVATFLGRMIKKFRTFGAHIKKEMAPLEGKYSYLEDKRTSQDPPQ